MNAWQELWSSVVREFSDLSAVEAVQISVRLIIAGLLGALIGRERAASGKAAGLRTHVLVAVGAAAFVAVPLQHGFQTDALGRIIQGLIAGVGFLGAGCILKPHAGREVLGLTTAAGIWFTAAIGIACGLGRELSAILVGVFGWITLALLTWFEPKEKLPPA